MPPGLRTRCRRTYQSLESFLEPRIIAHLHEAVRACLEWTGTLEVAATVVRWSIYGAALHRHKAERRHAEAFAEVVSPLIMGSMTSMSET